MGLFRREEKKRVSFDDLLQQKSKEQNIEKTKISDEEYNRLRFERMARENEMAKDVQQAGKHTQGVSWDEDFNPDRVYRRGRTYGGAYAPLYDNGRRPEDFCDYDHDGVPDCIENHWEEQRYR